MSETQPQKAIELSSVSKKYRLGTIGTGTLAGDMRQRLNKLRGKPDETGKIGMGDGAHIEGGEVWALQDIDLTIRQGEIVGLIGKNGAGKSTLLKLLSKVTSPSAGKIAIKGRMVSLLEVGTGMHPELTGRENVFLNGAILGMSKAEVEAKFDQIVDFSGCEEFIDTPVKRYSSGMKVRLGFSVAAFLEPEILIVDEVLAVGDADFQKRAIARIKEVSQHKNRTVIIVSHNMASVRTLCTRCILLAKGRVAYDGDVVECISRYLGYDSNSTSRSLTWNDARSAPSGKGLWVKSVVLQAPGKTLGEALAIEDALRLEVEICKTDPNLAIDCTLRIFSEFGDFIASSSSVYSMENQDDIPRTGDTKFTCEVPPHFFNQGIYVFGLLILENGKKAIIHLDDLFRIPFAASERNPVKWMGQSRSLILPRFLWRAEEM